MPQKLPFPVRGAIIKILLFVSICTYGQRYGTGLAFDDKAYNKTPIRTNLNNNEFNNLPSSYSLKANSPPPGNQLQLNTSPAWAVAWSAKSILESIQNGKAETNRVQKAASPAYLYHQTREISDKNCESGIGLNDALEFLKSEQISAFDDFLEFCPKYLPDNLKRAGSAETYDYRRLFDENQTDKNKLNAIKKSLSQNFPVVIGMYCPPSFFKAKEFWQPTELLDFDFPGHALCIIGYDDEKYGGAFEIINSWGSEWGNQGFIWIRYADFINFTRYAYEVFKIPGKNENMSFSGDVFLKMNTGNELKTTKLEPGKFLSKEPLRTGTHFRVYLKNDQPSYAYVFGIDNKREIFKIFPYERNVSPALLYDTDELTIPGEDSYIEIIGDPGEEHLYILYSRKPINFDEIISRLSEYPGNLLENLEGLLEGNIAHPDEITWKDQGISFDTRTGFNKAILIQIQINHI